MKKILLHTTTVFLSLIAVIQSETTLGFDDISRAGGVSLQEVSPTETEDGRRTIQLDGMTLNLGATEAERQQNYQVLNRQYQSLKQWFLGEFEENAGRYKGLGAFLWKKIESLASGMSQDNTSSQENIRKYMQMIIFAQSLKDRHQSDVALIPASAPEHEFYFRLVERPAGRLFALTEDFDSPEPRYPIKVKVDTRTDNLRVRGIQNANEVLGSLPKGTVIDAQAVMLKGLIPVGYRIVLRGNSSIGRRNGFLAGAYLAVENGASIRMLQGDDRNELTGLQYLYEKIWQSVRAGAEARGLSAAALLDSEAAAPVVTESVANTPSVSSDFWDAVEHWSQSVSEDLTPLRTAEGQAELQLPAQFQELVSEYPFFDPRNGGINREALKSMIAEATTQEEVDAIQVRVNELTQKFSQLLRPIEDPSPTAQTDSVFFYLENAKKFRDLEKQIADVNSRLSIAAGAEGLDLASVTRDTPLLFELKSALESDTVKEYFTSGKMNLSSLAQRFGDARARPYRAQVLGNLRTSVDKILAIDISRLTQEVRQRNNPDASPADSVTVTDSETDSEIASDVVVDAAPQPEVTPSQPV
ncbi:MAG: hypothetical protein H3C47_16665, partial [Candidatus Cloacimonetes bacterium]|nr:hypothetical protein [Candidatus Cloacimonadota bacterium]